MRIVASSPDPEPLPEAIRGILDAITPDDLRGSVGRLAVPRVYGTPENEAARRAILDLFSASGVARMGVEADDEGNVIVGDPRTARILVGAHYDAVPGTPGADDNASGVAALVAAARALGPRDEVCYVAFDGEECGFVGSRALVGRLGRDRPEQVHVLEMVGYRSREPGTQRNPVPPLPVPDVGDFLGLVGTHGSRHALDHALRCAGRSPIPALGLYLPDVPLESIATLAPHVLRSDHAPFWEAGVPALMWTDTAEFRNPHYHQPTDTPETLDYEFLAGVTRLLAQVVIGVLDDGGCFMSPIEAIVETAIYVDDLDAAEAFYRGVLGLEVIGDAAGRHVFFRVGNGVLLVFNPDVTLRGDLLPPHGARGPGHFALGVKAEAFDEWRRRLEGHGVMIEKEVEWPRGGRSLYFRDPAGNSVELITPGLWGLPGGW